MSVDDYAHKPHTFRSLIETKEYDVQLTEEELVQSCMKEHIGTLLLTEYTQRLASSIFLQGTTIITFGPCTHLVFSTDYCLCLIISYGVCAYQFPHNVAWFYYFAHSIMLHLFSLRASVSHRIFNEKHSSGNCISTPVLFPLGTLLFSIPFPELWFDALNWKWNI